MNSMAKADSITIDVNIAISDETVCRCLRILEMWQDDHPLDHIVFERVMTMQGPRHKAHIEWYKEEQHG